MKFKMFYEQEEPKTLDFFHSTKSEHLPSIIKNGFRVARGGKNKYGLGIYGTSDLQSQQSDLQSGNYGDTIIKSTIPTGNFIFFDKSAEDFDKQLEKYVDREEHSKIFDILVSNKKNPVFAAQFLTAYANQNPEILQSIDGVLVNDNGTNIVSYYNPEKINIDAYTKDGGKTWITAR